MNRLAVFTFILMTIVLTSYYFFFTEKSELRILVFSKTAEYRHKSIEAGKKALMDLCKKNGYKVDTTENAEIFTQKELQKYKVVIFLNTTGDILDNAQQTQFTRFIQAGGGFVGIHSATDTEYAWPWYGEMVGAYFENHPNNPNVREAIIDVIDKKHVSTKMLPERWKRKDEWYNFRNLNPNVHVLLKLDEKSYKGGTNGQNHPIAWCHEFDGGKVFYTGLGHTPETFSESLFLDHLWGGISYALGDKKPVNYGSSTVAPEENRFQKIVFEENLQEPMELVLLPDHSLLYIQRKGEVRRFDHEKGVSSVIHLFDVHSEHEDGLLGLALDPNFSKNRWVYFFYSPPEKSVQYVARFTMAYDYQSIDIASERILLEIPVQRDECCHSAGSLAFDKNGLLYISTGDNTNPHASQGFAPVDEREGRNPWDAQKSSANTKDLRGKILRIKPKDDGSYDIPDGNLFPKDGKIGRPEIYVMGCRNPYRIAIDNHTGFVYWGDVGPDSGADSTHRGPRGYDEVNQARKAGFFGWPYFIADNKAYKKFDFIKRASLEANNLKKPVNLSPNNTGSKELPSAQPAFVWYPYSDSKDFPLVGSGARNAMAGGVFYVKDYPDTPDRFPAYYDGKLFMYDWMRGWIMAVTMDKEGNFKRMERFLPGFKFNNLIDMIFSPAGDIYLLEYGTAWFSKNPDARLVHLKYNAGNRKPVAQITANRQLGAAPLKIAFSSEKSLDYDNDELKYEWDFGTDEGTSSEKNPVYTFKKPGKYVVRLLVSDKAGEESEASMEVWVGNELAVIDLLFEGNQTFYWDNQSIAYQVKVKDKEDGTIGKGIENQNISVSMDYLEQGYDINEISMGHQALQEASLSVAGKQLMDNLDCNNCHQLNKKSIGPAYNHIAQRYKNDKNAVDYLSGKIIKGGGGVWGETAMAAHPNLSKTEAEQITRYILSLVNQAETKKSLPVKGKYTFDEHINKGIEGKYIFNISYKDKGGQQIEPLTTQKMHAFRHPLIWASSYDDGFKAMKFQIKAGSQPGVKEDMDIVVGMSDAYIRYNQLDLTGIQSLDLMLTGGTSQFTDGNIEIHLDKPNGLLWTSYEVKHEQEKIVPKKISLAVEQVKGKHDIYVLIKSKDGAKPVTALISLYFNNSTL